MKKRYFEIARGVFMVDQDLVLALCAHDFIRRSSLYGNFICDTGGGNCIAVHASVKRCSRPQVAELPDRGAAIL